MRILSWGKESVQPRRGLFLAKFSSFGKNKDQPRDENDFIKDFRMKFREYLLSLHPLALKESAATPNGSVRISSYPDDRHNIPKSFKGRNNDFLLLHRPLSALEVADLEVAAKRAIPSAYKKFLSEMNGGSFFFRELHFHGKVTRSGRADFVNGSPIGLAEQNTLGRSTHLPEEYFKIGYYPNGGIMVTINSQQQCVLIANNLGFVSAPLKTWPSFEDMFTEECRRLAAFFDDHGKLKDPDALIGPPIDLASIVIEKPKKSSARPRSSQKKND